MKRLATFLIVAVVASTGAGADSPRQRVADKLGTTRGICVLIGDNECERAIQIARTSELLVYVQIADEADAAAACRAADEAGLYGTRIFVRQGSLDKLYPADNIADVVAVTGAGTDVSRSEVKRILRPGGKAIHPNGQYVKPMPDGADDWSHPYHGPDNNPQSDDTIIKAPYLTQFLADPRYAPLPQVAIASAGRVFKAFGHVAFKKREEAFLNKLVAFNGYNGTILWQRELPEGVMIHRNTFIATPEVLYVGDDKSCKVIDAATGELRNTIAPAVDKAGGTFWKWMALEDGTLYALIGEQEQRDETKRWKRKLHGWPWAPISEGFNQPNQPWGYGRNILAIDPESGKILWTQREQQPVDGRAICMKNGRIYAFSFGNYLTCLDARSGRIIWRKTPENARQLFEAIGKELPRQDWRTNWRTTCFMQCSDKAIYFAGPQVGKLLAVSTKDASVMWSNGYSNFQLVLRDDGLYAISGQIDKHPSKVFDPLTGEELASIAKERRACTRPTGSADAVFFRASGGSTRLDTGTKQPQWISPMRPNCHDGVTIANGLLYWWPSVCDCQLTLYGITSLAPAGDFDYAQKASSDERLTVYRPDLEDVEPLQTTDKDWPGFRANVRATATTAAFVPEKSSLLWKCEPGKIYPEGMPLPAAPVAAQNLAFSAGADGIIRAIDIDTGRQVWRAYTGGAIRVSPSIADGRLYVGSGDGYAYCFEAKTGQCLWKFRAAAKERIIGVYGSLMSTWPAAAGVLVDNGIAYVAAGIVNFDGTYLYALDAVTGEIKWQNTTSGHLTPGAMTGVSVQGHMLLHDGKLYLAGGTSISPAVYDAKTGKCLNDPTPPGATHSSSPRGWELALLGDHVAAVGRPFYAKPGVDVYDATVFNRAFMTARNNADVVWVTRQNQGQVMTLPKIDRKVLNEKLRGNTFNLDWKKLGIDLKPTWSHNCPNCVAMAVCDNAVVLAKETEVVALRLHDGTKLWSHELAVRPTAWGLAVARDGNAIVTLVDGSVLCFGKSTGHAAK